VKLLDLIRGRLVLPALAARDKRAAIEELVQFMVAEGAISTQQRAVIVKAVHGREDFMSTGMEHGIALPHGVTDAVEDELAAIGISKEGIPFESFDDLPAQIIILLLTPTGKALTRVRTLAEIARVVNEPTVRAGLIEAKTSEEAVGVLRSGGKQRR
jgi:mannitol/fructose-specific phosphotransferase system IIA component (Ntr-type)